MKLFSMIMLVAACATSALCAQETEEQKKRSCRCEDCKCTPESNCGCYTDAGCHCEPGSPCNIKPQPKEKETAAK